MAKPSAPPNDPRKQAIDALLTQATFELHRERPQEAERIAGEILKTNLRHPRALQVRGCALLMQGRVQEAVGILEDAVRSSHDPETETQLAIALRRCGRAAEALQVLKRAVKRRPPFPAAFHELGFLLVKLDHSDEAIKVLERGIALLPDDADLASQLGYVFEARNDRAKARAAFTRALSISPRHPSALLGLAGVLFDGGEFAQAASTLQFYLTLMPQDADAGIKLGACLLELGQLQAAYGCLRAATRSGSKYYGKALGSLSRAGNGRFWLRPSDAARFFRGEKI